MHINVRENRRDNQEWTIQRNWQHLVYKIRDEYTQNKKNNTTQKTKTVSNTDPIKNQGMNTGAREEQRTPSKTRG
jgi:hypothetical protein